MKFKILVEYEYPIEHKLPVKAEIVLHGDRVVTDNIKWVEQEPTTKNDLGVDAVSRKDVHDMLENLPVTVENKWFNWLQMACMRLADLPSVTPIRPKGHWIDKNHLFETCSAECSSCHKRSNGYVYDNGFSLECKYYDFCPKCGADMSEVEDGNDD